VFFVTPVVSSAGLVRKVARLSISTLPT
jgi:hypothetical protein